MIVQKLFSYLKESKEIDWLSLKILSKIQMPFGNRFSVFLFSYPTRLSFGGFKVISDKDESSNLFDMAKVGKILLGAINDFLKAEKLAELLDVNYGYTIYDRIISEMAVIPPKTNNPFILWWYNQQVKKYRDTLKKYEAKSLTGAFFGLNLLGLGNILQDIIVSRVFCESISIPFPLNFEHERVGSRIYIKGVSYNTDISMSFYDTQEGLVYRYFYDWLFSIIEPRSILDYRGVVISDDIEYAKKGAIVMIKGSDNSYSYPSFLISGLLPKKINDLSLSQGASEPMKVEVEFSCDWIYPLDYVLDLVLKSDVSTSGVASFI